MEENKSSVGSIIGTIIIISLIVLGGLYFWGKHIKESKSLEDLTSSYSVNNTASTEMSSSDELNSIEADLQNINLDNLDTELNSELE